LFETLYAHDLESQVGDTVSRDGLTFCKLFTNPSFADPAAYVSTRFPDLNLGTTTRMYADPQWFGYSILWNSVYEVSEQRPERSRR